MTSSAIWLCQPFATLINRCLTAFPIGGSDRWGALRGAGADPTLPRLQRSAEGRWRTFHRLIEKSRRALKTQYLMAGV
jgi:hypothetical protein